MIRNYLLVAFRRLRRNRLYSIVNVLGLSIGITCCIIVAMFVREEITFDKFHTNSDSIYRAWVFEKYGEGEEFFNSVTPIILAPTLEDNIPEVETTVQFGVLSSQVKTQEGNSTESINIASSNFFEVFNFPLLRGDRATSLLGKNDVVLTKTLAEKYFGSADAALGKTLEFQLNESFIPFTITAIAANPPANSSIQFDIMISTQNMDIVFSDRARRSWFNVAIETYVLLKDNSTMTSLEANLASMVKQVIPDMEGEYTIGMQPLSDIHLNNKMPVGIAPVSDPKYSWILSAIAILVLLVASINYITLSVAQSLNQAKEVGVRKVAGARRGQLIFQYLGESALTTFLAFSLAMIFTAILLPMFNDLSGKNLLLDFSPFMVAMGLLILLVVSTLAGIYPALILSGFKPISILKGSVKVGDSRQKSRKVMVIFQFALSIFLLASTLIMKEQIEFLQKMNLGYNKDRKIIVQLNIPNEGGFIGRIVKGFELGETYKSELSRFGEIKSVCVSSQVPASGKWIDVGFTDDQGNYREFQTNFVDQNYVSSMGLVIAEGRDFSEENATDYRRSILVNQAFVKEFSMENPIGSRIPGENFDDHEIIGVIEDFNFQSLHSPVQPLAMSMNPMVIASGIENINISSSPIPKLTIELGENNVQAGVARVKETWLKLSGGETFDFTFLEQNLATQYLQEQRLSKMMNIAGGLAIVIGCLGLFGLASITLVSRLKEISIRKVLGATPNNIATLLSKEYALVIIFAMVLAAPFTITALNKWLQGFEYKVNFGVSSLLLSGGIVLLISIATLSFQIVKASSTQVSESLKHE